MGNNEFVVVNKTTVLWRKMDMVDDKINKLIEKFIDVKESKGLTEEQVAKLSGFTPLRIHNLFNGKVVHPSFDLTTKVAEALEIPFDEVCEILGLNIPNDIEVGCECYIGVCLDRDIMGLITRKIFYQMENVNYECFRFCPKCGKKIDWDAIIENH